MNEPNILIIETATEVCSVAIACGNKLIVEKETQKQNSHSSLINTFIKDVLQKANLKFDDLNAIAISEGPGSYTGLRIGASAAKALAYSLNKPLIAFNTLKSLANGIVSYMTHVDEFQYISTLDARRDELYIAIYDNNLNEILAPTNKILPNKELNDLLLSKQCVIVGNAALKLNDFQEFECQIKSDIINYSAKNAVGIVYTKYLKEDFCDVAYFEPNYIKPFYTTAKKLKL